MSYKNAFKRFWAPIITSIAGVAIFGSIIFVSFDIGSDPNALNNLYVIVGASVGTLIIRESLSDIISSASIAGQIADNKWNIKRWFLATIILLSAFYIPFLAIPDLIEISLDSTHHLMLILLCAYLALPGMVSTLDHTIKAYLKFIFGIIVALFTVAMLRFGFEGSIISWSELFQVTGPIILGTIIIAGLLAVIKVLFTPTPEEIAKDDSGPSVSVDSSEGEEFLNALTHLTNEWLCDGMRGETELIINGKKEQTYTIPEQTDQAYQAILRELNQEGDNPYREYPDNVDTSKSLVIVHSESLDDESLIANLKNRILLRYHTFLRSLQMENSN